MQRTRHRSAIKSALHWADGRDRDAYEPVAAVFLALLRSLRYTGQRFAETVSYDCLA